MNDLMTDTDEFKLVDSDVKSLDARVSAGSMVTIATKWQIQLTFFF